MPLAHLPVMRRQEAIARVGRHRLDAAVLSGQVVVIAEGVVVGEATLTAANHVEAHAMAVFAAQLRLDGLVAASHGSAALLHGLSRLGRPSGRLRLTRANGRYRRVDVDARVHVCALPVEHTTTVQGVCATTIARTAVDLARTVTFKSAVVVADSALRLGCTREEMEAVARFCTRWPGVRQARRVVSFARAAAETPLESVSRVVFHDSELPEPELQYELRDHGRFLARVDFYWPEFRTVGEADGMLKYTPADPTALIREKRRQERIEQAGYEVVRWSWDEIWRQPEWTVTRIRQAFVRGKRAA